MTNHYQELQTNPSLKVLIKKLEEKEPVFTFVYGRAGTGKSVGVAQILSRLQKGASPLALELYPDRLNVFTSKGIKAVDISKFSDSCGLEFNSSEFIEGVLAASNPSIIVIDEVQLSDKNTCEYFYELIKTRRKRNLSIICISQSLDALGEEFSRHADFIFEATRVDSIFKIDAHDRTKEVNGCNQNPPSTLSDISVDGTIIH